MLIAGASKENVILAKKFMTQAQTDLDDVKTLYEKGSYANSAYFLQQSVEKTTKAYGLMTCLTKKDLKSVGHKTPRVAIKMIRDKFNENPEMQGIIQFMNLYGIWNSKDATEKIKLASDAVETKEQEFASQSKEQISSIII